MFNRTIGALIVATQSNPTPRMFSDISWDEIKQTIFAEVMNIS